MLTVKVMLKNLTVNWKASLTVIRTLASSILNMNDHIPNCFQFLQSDHHHDRK